MSAPTGTIYLIANAVIDKTYQHTIDFKSANEQLAYWRSLSKFTLTEYTYIRKQREFIQVDRTMSELENINYLVFQADKSGRWIFAFVDDKEYVDETSTLIYFTIDVFQTNLFKIKFNPSYILQEHQDRWDAEHKPIYSRTDEGLDYGSEYTVESAYKIKREDVEGVNTGDEKFYLIFCTEHKKLVSEGTASEPSDINDVPNPYCIYLVPGTIPFIYDGTNVQMVSNIYQLSDFMLKSSFGEYVKQIVLLPYLPFKYQIGEVTSDNVTYKAIDLTVNNDITLDSTTIVEGDYSAKLMKIRSIKNGAFKKLLAEMSVTEGLENALPTAKQWEEIKANPYKLERDRRFESKLLCYPYRYNLLTDWRNTPLTVKNEYMTGDKIKVNMTASFGFNAPYRYHIDGYKKDPEGRGNSISQMLQFDYPVISDAYQTYMLQNRNQIQANQTNAIVSAATSAVQGVVGGAIFGGIGGAVGGLLGSGLSGAVSVQNHIRSENAKQKDIKNLPDSIMGSNESAINVIDGNTYLTFYRYKIACEFEEQLAQYWHMYGYICKRVKTPNLKSRTRFNYIKTVGANITGSISQDELRQIREIFDNGITIWHYNPSEFRPLDYTYENIEVLLV